MLELNSASVLRLESRVMYSIRHALLEEYEIAAPLAVRAFSEFSDSIRPEHWSAFKEIISETTQLRSGGELLLAVHDGIIVGSVVYRDPACVTEHPFGLDSASLRTLAVQPNFRGRGAARALIGACLELARNDGYEQFAVSLGIIMTNARKLFANLRFSETATQATIAGLKCVKADINI